MMVSTGSRLYANWLRALIEKVMVCRGRFSRILDFWFLIISEVSRGHTIWLFNLAMEVAHIVR